MMMDDTLAKNLKDVTKNVKFLGLVIVLICFGGFGAWAALAPLSSAAIATGKVSPDGSRKVIQHLEGGIVHEMPVHEGLVVKKGDVLVRLEQTQARANYSARYKQLMRLRFTRARLFAQAAEHNELEVGEVFQAIKDSDFQNFIKTQKNIFEIKIQSLKHKKKISERQIEQVNEEINSLNARNEGLRQQLVYLRKEILAKEELNAQGLIRAPLLYAVQRKHYELLSEVESNKAKVARAKLKVHEIRLSLQAENSEYHDQTSAELTDINAQLAQTDEAVTATGDVLKRTEVLSPVDGTVLNIRYKTIGGVVKPGDAIMDIVPSQDELIIDAELSPNDIDNVKIGMPAQIRVSAFLARHIPMFTGEVTRIAADATLDPDTRETHYTIKIKVPPEQFQSMNDQIKLMPGMPAEVFVMTGMHTPLDYLIDPVRRSFERAFREETESH